MLKTDKIIFFELTIHACFQQKPHDAWTVICKGLPTWKAEWKDRPNNDCFFCPPAFKQDKGARVVDQWTDNDGVVKGQLFFRRSIIFKLIISGREIRVRFQTETLADTCTEGFIFALKFRSFVLPDDVFIQMPGAEILSISPDRTLVTFKPQSDLSSWVRTIKYYIAMNQGLVKKIETIFI